MAQMYPTPMDPNTVSHAERTLYALFREQLDDAYLFLTKCAHFTNARADTDVEIVPDAW